MRILVIGSCGKKKSITSTETPTCEDLASIDDNREWRKKLGRTSIRARELYIGNQNRELVNGVDLLRQIEKIEIKFSILSAGFGLVDENDLIVLENANARQRARLLDAIFNELGVRPFEDEGDYAVGAEWIDA